MEPQKPFACSMLDCGMSFTNEDHLHVHTKKHDMSLQLGSEQKANFVADQTPTPTRFIRNCEEVGLFQELQNVNPFDEGFKRAMETKAGTLSLEGAMSTSTDDVLHTPQMVLPTLGDRFTSSNNRSDVTISRSSSDESGVIKEYETTTISKRNEVTTISRIIGKQDILDKVTTTGDVSIVRHEELDSNNDVVNETVSYTNNIIKIHSNVEIRKDNQDVAKDITPVALISYEDGVSKANVVTKDVMLADRNKLQVPDGDKIPIMSQKSIDFVVDSLTSDSGCPQDGVYLERDKISPLVKMLRKRIDNAVVNKVGNPEIVGASTVVKPSDAFTGNSEDFKNRKRKVSNEVKNTDDYEVIIKLPNKTVIRLKAFEDEVKQEKRPQIQNKTKEKLKKTLIEKVQTKVIPRQFQNVPINKAQTKLVSTPVQNVPMIQPQNWPLSNGLPITSGTLYPVTIVNPNVTQVLLTNTLQKIPIPLEKSLKFMQKPKQLYRKTVKRKDGTVCSLEEMNIIDIVDKQNDDCESNEELINQIKRIDRNEAGMKVKEAKSNSKSQINCIQNRIFEEKSTFRRNNLDNRNAASKRYRERLKRTMESQKVENEQLRERNNQLIAENAALKQLLMDHCRTCADARQLKNLPQIIQNKIRDLK